jgi:uncharacterized protein YceH (UPF0502 family)
MTQLTPDEARELGVLIEKSTTTPDQYPLSLNAVVAGANQKNNRDPVTNLSEDAAWDALEGLRAKSLVVRIEAGAGSRVHRFRHNATDTLRVRAGELAVLAELLLRGPQTQGELRGRASRMHPMETLEVVRDMLRALGDRPDPLAKQIPPSPGSRAERYLQLLSPDLHDVGDTSGATEVSGTDAAPMPAQGQPTAAGTSSSNGLADRVTALEADVAQLRDALRKFAASLGESDPLP